MTYADVLRPKAMPFTLIYDLALILGSSLLVTASARVEIPLPFSPVPITGQTFSVLLVGAILGSRRGALSLLAYVAQGAAGLPVFAGGGAGPAHLLGPTGGYLLGFVAASALTGALAERDWDRKLRSALPAMVLGNLMIYAFGLPWLATFVGAGNVLALGLLPFIPGDLLKIALAALLLPAAWRLVSRASNPPVI